MKILDSNVTIMVKSISNAIKFYEQIGLTLKKRWEDHYAMMTTSGITIGLHPANETDLNESGVSIGFMVEDIQEAKSLLEKINIRYSEDDGKSGTYLYFRDIDGTILYFVKQKWE